MQENEGVLRGINSLMPEIEIAAGTFLHARQWNQDSTIRTIDWILRHISEILTIHYKTSPILESILERFQISLKNFISNGLPKTEEEAKSKFLSILINFRNNLVKAGYYKKLNVEKLQELISQFEVRKNIKV